MIWLVLAALGSSFLVSWIAGFVVRTAAPRLGLVDRPGPRKVHHAPVPLGGGLAVWLGVVAPLAAGAILVGYVLAAGPSSKTEPSWIPAILLEHAAGLASRGGQLTAFLALATGMLVLGLVDDARGVNWKVRLAIEFALAAAVVFGLGWRLSFFIDIPAVTAAATIFWIVWLVNAFNMLDNMDALSGGVAAIAAATLAAVLLAAPTATHGPQLFVGGLLLLLVGALTGFLYHNRPPAKLFLGDSGAYFVGFSLAICTILATFAGGDAPRHSILAPLCVLAIPLYDTTTVLFIRLRQRRSPFVGDKSHFSHRLFDLGMSKPQAVATIYLAAAVCGLGALLLHQVDALGAAVVLAMVAGVLALLAILEVAARRHVQSDR